MNAGSINIVNSAANWAGWAVNSFAAKFYKGKPGDPTTSTSKPEGERMSAHLVFSVGPDGGPILLPLVGHNPQ